MDLIVDKDGYLEDIDSWSESVAYILAGRANIILTDDHLEVVKLLRSFYITFEHSPTHRAFVKYIEKQLGKGKGNGLYLAKLFPNSPIKTAALIAGLPRPSNCF